MRLFALALIAAACSEQPPSQVPPPAPNDARAPAPAPAPTVAPAAPPAVDFRLRLALTGDAFCHLLGIAPLESGSAWVSGDCNLRMLLHGEGMDLQLASDERIRFDFAGTQGECPARWMFPAIVAADRDDAFVLAEQRCGLDPNALWPRPAMRFDGSTWKPVAGREAARKPWYLERTRDGAIWGMASDEAISSPNDAIYRWSKLGWQPVSFVIRSPDAPVDLTRFAVTDAGEIWLPDRQARGAWRGATKTGWTFHPLPKENTWAHDVVVGEDGAVYVVCSSHSYRWDGQRFVRVAPGGYSAWPRSASDIIIFGVDQRLGHFDGNTLTPLAAEEPERIDFLKLRAAGGHLWALGRQAVWSLALPGEPVPPPQRFEPHFASDG